MFLFRVVRTLLLKMLFKSYLRRKVYALEKLKGRKPKLLFVDRFINVLLKYLIYHCFYFSRTCHCVTCYSLVWCVWTEKWFGVNEDNKRMVKWAKIKKVIETHGTFTNFVIKSTLGFISKYV